jgi:molybdate transport repressor ModE-like protein
MLKLSIKPHWQLHKASATHSLPRVLDLLHAIEQELSVSAAATQLGLSYRHAWGLIRRAHRDFGVPLVNMTRGKRATLTEVGKKLVAADRRIAARIAPLLDSLASELESEIERARSGDGTVLRIHASHGYAIELLRTFLTRRNVPVDLRYRSSMEGMAALAGGDCELAGFHVPTGELQRAALAFYAKWLDPARQVLISLATRRQGIMVAPGNPREIQSLADLARPGVPFVNRQLGSGTRILLDLLLRREGIDSRAIAGYDTGEFTHSGIASCVASGLADAGFGVENGAREFGLDFVPIAHERYFLVCRREALELPTLRRIREILASKEYRAEAGHFAGIDVTDAAGVLTIEEAFPQFALA